MFISHVHEGCRSLSENFLLFTCDGKIEVDIANTDINLGILC